MCEKEVKREGGREGGREDVSGLEGGRNVFIYSDYLFVLSISLITCIRRMSFNHLLQLPRGSEWPGRHKSPSQFIRTWLLAVFFQDLKYCSYFPGVDYLVGGEGGGGKGGGGGGRGAGALKEKGGEGGDVNQCKKKTQK